MSNAFSRSWFLFLCFALILFAGCAGTQDELVRERRIAASTKRDGDPPDFLALLREAQKNYESIDDYTALFTKRQRIKRELLPEEEIFMKYRKPHAVYMKWQGKVDKGKEALYVKGKYNDKLIAHKGGFLLSRITVAVDPNGSMALKKNLRPITCAGIGFLVNSLKEVTERAAGNNDMRIEYRGLVDLPDGKAHKFERYLDEQKGYPCHRAVVCLDEDTSFPAIYEAYDKEGNLLERYTYSNMKPNQGLGEEHFDRYNKEYRFR